MGGDEEAEEARVTWGPNEYDLRLWGSGTQQFAANTAAAPSSVPAPPPSSEGTLVTFGGPYVWLAS